MLMNTVSGKDFTYHGLKTSIHVLNKRDRD